MAHNYLYTPVSGNQIRLIYLLQASSPDAQLECEVRVHERNKAPSCEAVPFNKAPSYEAVSYVWDREVEQYIQLKIRPSESSRFTENRVFLIQPNLASALKQFRWTDKPRVLWSDAICIDQNNDVEKSQQVPLMESTYSQALRVLVWLGEATTTSPRAMSFMRRMLGNDANLDELARGYPDQWAALESLLRMSWFTRRWIVQEIALAKTAILYCGSDEILWEEFCEAVTLFQEYHLDIKPAFLSETYHYSRNHLGEVKALGACRLVDITTNLFQRSPDGTIQRRLVNLETLVSSLTMFRATRDHDVIYAMIPIARDIQTVSQKDRTIALGALPVETPPADELPELSSNPSKRRKTARSSFNAQRWRKATQQVMPNPEQLDSLDEPDSRRRKGEDRFHGVVKDMVRAQPSKFRVDYRQSFLRVCMDFVAYAILQSHSLDIICRPWVPEELSEKYKLPSWLLNEAACPFRPQANGTFVRVNADPLVGSDAMPVKRYKACGEISRARRLTRANPREGWGFGFFDRHSDFNDEPGSHRSLFVSGFMLDYIGDIQDKAEDGTIPGDWFSFAGWQNQSKLPPDHLLRTLVANREPDGTHVARHHPRTLQKVMRQHGARGGAFNVKRILETPVCDRHSEKLLNRILEVTPGRRLFRTTVASSQTLGLAPARARRGDMVCILFGCSVPVVLRHQTQRLGEKLVDYYEFVGDAYVDGMMEGAAIEEQDRIIGERKKLQESWTEFESKQFEVR